MLPRTNSPGWRTTLGRVDLDQPGEVGLVQRRVDDRVLVVVEEPEELVEADVDAARLDHRRVPGVESDPSGVDLGADVTVGEEHEGRLPAGPAEPGGRVEWGPGFG